MLYSFDKVWDIVSQQKKVVKYYFKIFIEFSPLPLWERACPERSEGCRKAADEGGGCGVCLKKSPGASHHPLSKGGERLFKQKPQEKKKYFYFFTTISEGKVTIKHAPLPNSLSALTVPPNSSTNFFTICKPKPAPL